MTGIKQSKEQKKDATLYRAVEEGLTETTNEQRPKDQTTWNLGEKCSRSREQQAQRSWGRNVPGAREESKEARAAGVD